MEDESKYMGKIERNTNLIFNKIEKMDKELKEFNAYAALGDWDSSGYIGKAYCGPNKEYENGVEFNSLTDELKNKAINEIQIKLGDTIKSDIKVTEFDHLNDRYIVVPIGVAKVIDILMLNDSWKLRVRYAIVNNKRGKRWPHYSDIDFDKAILIESH